VEFAQWSPKEPAATLNFTAPGALPWLLERYGGSNPTVLRTVLGLAYELGASGAILEYRYIDADWRSEHARFYAGTFRRYASVAHRLHFFRERVPDSALAGDGTAGFAALGYLGYAVLRPVPAAPVGRVFMPPRPLDETALTCQSTDTVNLLGETLQVTGAAFMAQDAMLLRCAHATLWTTAYHHHRAFGSRRVLPSDIADAAPELGLGRSVPSAGLDVYQMSAASESLSLPPLIYKLDALPEDETLPRVACRYLNSGIPVICVGADHAFVLIGYRREGEGDHERIVFLRHDDEIGPYQIADDFLLDEYAPWEYFIVPLPAKVYMPGEDAEAIGRSHIVAALRDDPSPQAQAVTLGINEGTVTFRASVHRSNVFKSEVGDRGVTEPVASVYRRTHLSRWIWVVEAVVRDLRQAGKPCVISDAILDVTDHQRDMRVLLLRTPTQLAQWNPDTDRTLLRSNLTPQSPWSSSGHAQR
jgi:hypothetical protein